MQEQKQGGLWVPGKNTGREQSSTLDSLNKFYEDLLGASDQSWADQQGTLKQQMNEFMRGADVQNARLGRNSAGGGYATMAGSALGKGMDVYNQAQQEYQKGRLGLQKDWANANIDEQRRQEERGWAQDDQSRQEIMDYINMYVQTYGSMPYGALELLGGDLGAYGDQKNAAASEKEADKVDVGAAYKEQEAANEATIRDLRKRFGWS